jgi:hypothetical protein
MPGREKLYFLENLRTFLIFLVVLVHAGVVYESSGLMAPFWIVDDPATSDLPGLVNLISCPDSSRRLRWSGKEPGGFLRPRSGG